MPPETNEELLARVIRQADENGEFVTGADGFVVYWPEGQKGAMEAWYLRHIADELDARNRAWQEEIDVALRPCSKPLGSSGMICGLNQNHDGVCAANPDDPDDFARCGAPPEQIEYPDCPCRECATEFVKTHPLPGAASVNTGTVFDPRVGKMFLCETCGNKRCPHATDHRNACTGSNEPGQKGSDYEHALKP